jgi:hypothetical protein
MGLHSGRDFKVIVDDRIAGNTTMSGRGHLENRGGGGEPIAVEAKCCSYI